MHVATRTLTLRRPSGDIEVPIIVCMPEQEDDDDSWACRYEIGWPDETRSSQVVGHDSMQALVLVFQKIAADIYASEHHKSGALEFDGPDEGYGFPLGAHSRHLAVGSDANL